MTGVKHENRFLFDMVVPISGAKVVHQASSNPQPIVVEKLTGKYVTPNQSFQGSMTQAVQQEQLGACGGSKNHFFPRDTMNQAVLLAQLDMKKKNRNPDAALPPKREATEKMPKSLKTKQSSQIKVHEVSNKPKKNASVQITCLSNKRKSPEPTPLSQLPATTNSPPTHDKEPGIGYLQDIERLQGDISKQITEMRELLENLVKECNNPKTVHPEEDREPPDPSHEQGSLRSITRQVYIVQQQIADVERKLKVMHSYKTAAHVYANKMSWAKSRLTSAYRGAYKSLQGMTNHLRRFAGLSADPVFQLRLVDLLSQLLQSIHQLFDIYLQLTNNCNSNSPELLELVDIIDALQAEWQEKLEYKLKRLMSNTVQSSTTSPGSSKKKTKFIKKNPRQQLSVDVTPERKSILRTSSEPSNLTRAANKMTKKLPATKKNNKSVIFSAQIQAHRKPHEVSNQNGYAQPTLSSRMKSLSDLKQEEKSESPELRQSPQTILNENREQQSPPPASSPSSVVLPGFGSQQFASNSKNKMKNIGESIIEELLTLESNKQVQQEAKCSSTIVNDTRDVDSQQSKSDVGFTDEAFKSVDLNLPPLEVLLHRLQEMEKEEIQIRSRWASSRYHDIEAATEECFKAKGSLMTANHQPHSPSPIIFSKKTDTRQTFEIFQEQPQRHSSGEFPGAIRFTKSARKSTFQEMQIEDDEQKSDDDSGNQRIHLVHQQKQKITNLDYQGRKPKRLFLSNKILKNITENRQRFSNYLLSSAYHQVESFDPWHLTEELADSILEDCIQEVSEEMQDLSHDLVHHLFNNEFIQFSSPSNIQPPPTKMLDISE